MKQNDRFKFRVWDIEWVKNPERMAYSDYPKNFDINALAESDRNILMQSTGLKDKNGNLIYEGDIVKWLERKYVITWIEDEACFKAISVDNEITTTLKLHGDCEVLGNKFENPELLK